MAAPPSRAPIGKNTVGPSGWVGVAGVVLNALIYALQQSAGLLPPAWGNAIVGVISLLTVAGIYRAPNHVVTFNERK